MNKETITILYKKVIDMRVKNIGIENFNPKVCVPIVDNTIKKSLDTARELVDKEVEVIEWRLDYLSELKDKDVLLNGLNSMASICDNVILIGTIRTVEEGGKASFKEDEMKEYLSLLADSKTVDFIDLEYFTYERPREFITKLRTKGAKIIASHHDFDETPLDDILLTILEEMECSECDVVKLAVMPETTTDVTRFMDVCNTFAMETEKVFICMSMGELGKVSRYAGNVTGSAITFGAYKDVSAPGQIEYKELMEIVG